MRFYDLEVHSSFSGGENTIAQLAKFAEFLGYSGIAICDKYENIEKLKHLKDQISKIETAVDIFLGAKIQVGTPEEMKAIVEKIREDVDLIIVGGGNYAVNRAACENPKVDILMHPEQGRYDCGLDEVCLNQAAKNNVAIGINFKDILIRYRRSRSVVLDHMAKNMRLCREIKVPVVICSGATSIWDMRDPRELISIANIFGLEFENAFSCVSTIPQNIIENNRKKLTGKTITEGVELE